MCTFESKFRDFAVLFFFFKRNINKDTLLFCFSTHVSLTDSFEMFSHPLLILLRCFLMVSDAENMWGISLRYIFMP